MKRMQLIAVALCLIVIATVGAGVVAAQQEPQQKRVKQFDVNDQVGKPVGKITVNTDTWKYGLNARGLSPGKTYWLKCEGVQGVIATAAANADGNLHMQGVVNQAPPQLVATGVRYTLGTGPLPPETSTSPLIDGKECAGGQATTSVYGTLKDSSGNALGGKTVYICTYDPDTLELYLDAAGTLTTKSDGTFCGTYFGSPRGDNIAAVYEGVSPYAVDYNLEKVFTCPICK